MHIYSLKLKWVSLKIKTKLCAWCRVLRLKWTQPHTHICMHTNTHFLLLCAISKKSGIYKFDMTFASNFATNRKLHAYKHAPKSTQQTRRHYFISFTMRRSLKLCKCVYSYFSGDHFFRIHSNELTHWLEPAFYHPVFVYLYMCALSRAYAAGKRKRSQSHFMQISTAMR